MCITRFLSSRVTPVAEVSPPEQKPEEPVEPVQQEAPPPPAPEPRHPGTVKGPFRINYDFARMKERMAARSNKSLEVKLSREEAELLDEPPVEIPKLVSKSVYLNTSDAKLLDILDLNVYYRVIM